MSPKFSVIASEVIPRFILSFFWILSLPWNWLFKNKFAWSNLNSAESLLGTSSVLSEEKTELNWIFGSIIIVVLSVRKPYWLLAATENPEEILSMYLFSLLSVEGLPWIEYKSSPIFASASKVIFVKFNFLLILPNPDHLLIS